jgi:hypothetical protein
MKGSEAAKKTKMVADLDARTITVDCPGHDKVTIPFEHCQSFSYGAGMPSAD